MMLGAIGGSDTLVGLTIGEIQQLEESVRKTIARVVNPELTALTLDSPHRLFARWLSKTVRRTPVEIFTVNYDVLLEHALEAERVPLFDGFVGSYQPFFNSDSLRRTEAAPAAAWARLWKMHGSVTWRRVDQDGKMRVIRTTPDGSGEMIYPSFEKYDESRQQPYSAFSDRLGRFLDQEDALLVSVGYSFGDEHINNLLFGSLENRSRAHAYALQFSEPPVTSDLAKRAAQRPNMLVLGPDQGCIGGRQGPWRKDGATSSEDGAFIATPGATAGAPASAVSMKIGDFSVFCKFLQNMTE
ncbi:SIR2 family protein [Mesorhizobium onobrychidis]|uniref:SIR2 family protein n=2 Tax=Mesorhizobium onobrychidis TaxID=2775404 RepID=A0ABY5R9E8_9HYPH|nr:SIR2 family protein [Mesorhizobium onobrychidis]